MMPSVTSVAISVDPRSAMNAENGDSAANTIGRLSAPRTSPNTGRNSSNNVSTAMIITSRPTLAGSCISSLK